MITLSRIPRLERWVLKPKKPAAFRRGLFEWSVVFLLDRARADVVVDNKYEYKNKRGYDGQHEEHSLFRNAANILPALRQVKLFYKKR